ncbi:MAG: HEAT repeat domain-containing protein [Chloroflexi bacterium]|nr:HEAT repeat domain-containing protein [Chloroflexota bacterium]
MNEILPNSTLSELIDKLVAGELVEQIEARTALTKLGSAAVEPLIQLLQNSQYIYSWWLVAAILGNVGDKRVVEPLTELLKNPASFDAGLARKYTAWALGKLKDPRAVDELIKVLHDRIHDDSEDDYVVDEPDVETIEAAIWALTEIGDLQAIEPIIQRLLEGDYWQEGEFLAKWGEPALKLLLDALNNDDDSIRGYAASLLGEMGDSRAVEPLINLLQNDRSDRVRHHAAYGLGELRDPRAYDALLTALNDSYEQTRVYAAMGLGHLKDRRALDALKKAAHDEQSVVRNSAEWAINWIGES